MDVQCCIADGGPAGLMLGFLLARAGVCVAVLEKHADFLRDFRGDTIHPSTLELMHELGLLDEFLKLPHVEAHRIGVRIGQRTLTVASFAGLPTRCKYVALMPQWDFLSFLAERGARYPGFTLLMETEATALIEEGGSVIGLRAEGPDGPLEIRAPLVIGCDGRGSTLRAEAGLEVRDLGAPMDVLWMRLPRRPEDGEEPAGAFAAGRIFIMLNRGDYWQCAFVIPKGGEATVRARGLPAFREAVLALAPFLGERVETVEDWDRVKLLTVKVDRLETWWKPGLLCIGDAAHAMSPIGGVGVNLAVQDAVAAANILAGPLSEGKVTTEHLVAVQERREFPTRVTQGLQITVQDRVIGPVLADTAELKVPLGLRLLDRLPLLQRIPGRLIGLGVRPEHVRTPEAPGPAAISAAPP